MGGKQSIFTEEELEDYQEFTYFTKKEILHAFKRFCELEPENNAIDKSTRISKENIMMFPELQYNPFKDRVVTVFSADGSGDMTFDDFLEMVSTFSDSAPSGLKTEKAFQIYDFDGDGQISAEDLEHVIKHLLGQNQLDEEDMGRLIDNIFVEADMDEDRQLSYAEFEHVMSKAPDFASTFRMRI